MTTNLLEHVRVLSEDIGSRMVGTPGNRAAADYITGVFERYGLAVERQAFSCPSWQARSARLTLAGRPFKAYANTFSPSCSAAGSVLPAGTLGELEAALASGKIEGSVVVLYGELAQGPLSPKNFFFAGERDLKVIAALEQGRPAAVITVHPTLGLRSRLIEDPDFHIPSATVPLGVGLELVRCCGAEARLKIDAAAVEDGRTENMIARLPGSAAARGDAAPRRIVVCAHYDTKPDTPGAVDNGCGVAVVLEVARRFKDAVPLPVDLEFVAFSNEEFYTSPEKDVYFQTAGPSFGQIAAAINIDGIGSLVSATNLATFSGTPEFEAAVEGVQAGFPGVYRTDPWPASNHHLFYSHGVPSIALSSGGPNFGSIIHTPNDTFAWVGENKLVECAGLVERLVSVLGS